MKRFTKDDFSRVTWTPALSACLLWAVAVSLGAEIPAERRRQIDGAIPKRATADVPKERRVLIWNTPEHLMEKDPHKGYCIPYGAYALERLGTRTGAYVPVVSDDLALFLPENIGRFDAIVMNNSSGPWITPTEADMARPEFQKHGAAASEVEAVLRRSLVEYVRGGGGLAGIHYAIGANRQWEEFAELWGAAYDGHPWNEEVAIRVDEPMHPLVRGLGGGPLRLADEIYQFKPPYSREGVRVLLSLDTNETNMGVQWIRRTDGDFALAWIRNVGKGRLFYTTLGHRTEIYWNPAVLQLYLNGIQFAAGDLTADATPRPEAGFVSIFNGKDLTGWEGDSSLWSVEEGAITGRTSAESRLKENQFLVWRGGQPGDFELRCQFKLVGGNSGIYFHAEKRRANERDPLIGPQADFSADHRWTGVLMEYLKRDVLAERGQKVHIDENGRKTVVGSFGSPEELLRVVRNEEWNTYRLVARGSRVVLEINGVTLCEVIDDDPHRTPSGHLALQVHQGPPMTVRFRDIRLRQFE